MINHYSMVRLWAILNLVTFILLAATTPAKTHNDDRLFAEAAELVPIIPILECVEDLGNGRFKATFGYDNPNGKVVTVPRGNSRIVWYETLRQEKVFNKFQPGVHESVLEAEFDINTVEDGLTWIVRIPKKVSMEASADANSAICEPDISSIENFKATAVSTTQIDLSWDIPTASEPFYYTIERSVTGNDPWVEVVDNLPQETTNYSDQGLEEFTIYYYRIYASNGSGASDIASTQGSTLSPITTVFNENGKADGKVELALLALAEGQAGANPSELVYQFNDAGDVLVKIIAFLDPSTISAVIDLLQQTYGRVASDFVLDPQTYINENINDIDVYMPSLVLPDLNNEPDINFAYAAYRPILSNSILGETGVLSQGDSSQTTREVRESFRVTLLNGEGELEAFPVDGTGISVGVLSNSFNTQPFSGPDSRYVTDQKNRDLPGPFNPIRPDQVNVLEEGPDNTDEGRAMLHIVHDVAPGAQLGFHTGTQTINKLAEGIDALSTNGYQVLIDDITFLTMSYFIRSGPVFEAIDDHVNRAQGNMYFTSAGNFANKAWQGVFTPEPLPDGTIYQEGTTGWVHSQQLDMNVESDGEYIVVLQWDEPAASHGSPTGALFDLDLTVANESLRPIAGNNKYSVERDPTEIMVIKSEAASSAKLVVTCECETPPTNLAFRVVMFKTTRDDGSEGLTFANPLDAPTITGQAMSDNAVAVGASFYGYYDSGAGPDNEPFSSFGGTLPNLDEVLPNITASDGSNTGVLSIGEDIEFDTDSQFTNFFGTSAAAPHAAAAAALYLSVAPIWYPDGIADKLTDPIYATGNPADEVLGLFTQTAVPTSNPAQGGPGLLKAVEAFKLIASQTPVITDAMGEEGKTISAEEVLVTLIGNYFTPSSQVLFDDEEVATTYISETEIQGLIPAFSGQGKLTVITNTSSTPTGTDNPVSDGFDLLDGRRAINIIADDITLEFGQDYLDNLTYTVEGLEEGETLESLGYPEVLLSPTAVGTYPDVNNYTVFGAFTEPLTPEQQEQSIITFVPGTLSFTHKDLTIQPQDTTAIYGEEPIILMNYIYDDTGISDNTDFMNTLRSEHRSTYFTEDNGSGLVNRFSAVVNRFSAVVNENPGRINELLNLIENSNWVATRTTIENRFSPVVNGFNLVGFDADQLIDYLDNPLVGNSGSIENRFSAVVNGSDLVNGLTSIYNPLENRFSPVVNRFSAVVNRFSAVVNIPLGDEDDVTDYSELLAIVDTEDGVPEGTDPDALPPTEVYSIDVITGTDVTETEEDRHYILPGAPLSPFFANFNKNLLAGRLAWTPKSITVDLDDGEEEPFEIQYGEAQPSYSSTVDPLGYQDQVAVTFNLDPEATEPVGAGDYSIVQEVTIADPEGADKTFNYEITSIDGSLVVNPGTLTITTDDVVVETGNDIPPASEMNSTISGFIPGETADDVFPPNGPVFSYSSDDYDNAGRVPGTYLLTTAVTQEPVNYVVEISDAHIFVNLSDGRKIRVYLDCVADNKGQGEYPYTAYFSYENDNDVSLFIEPESAENQLIGTSFDASSLPFEFLPGDHQFGVPFVGELRWQVSTFGSTHNSSQQIDSDKLKGHKCKPNEIINGRIAGTESGPEDTGLYNATKVQFYPNPVHDRLTVRVNQNFTNHDFELYDSQGIRHGVNVVIDPSKATAEFDFTNFETGLYLLKLNIDGTTAIIRILRQ